MYKIQRSAPHHIFPSLCFVMRSFWLLCHLSVCWQRLCGASNDKTTSTSPYPVHISQQQQMLHCNNNMKTATPSQHRRFLCGCNFAVDINAEWHINRRRVKRVPCRRGSMSTGYPYNVLIVDRFQIRVEIHFFIGMNSRIGFMNVRSLSLYSFL